MDTRLSEKFTRVLDLSEGAPSGEAILEEILNVAEVLMQKNASYGDSALNPLNLFFRGSAEEGISLYIDSKLSRIARGQEYPGDDTIMDLVGYMILLRVARRASYESSVIE